jgi:hypothetical protein
MGARTSSGLVPLTGVLAAISKLRTGFIRLKQRPFHHETRQRYLAGFRVPPAQTLLWHSPERRRCGAPCDARARRLLLT